MEEMERKLRQAERLIEELRSALEESNKRITAKMETESNSIVIAFYSGSLSSYDTALGRVKYIQEVLKDEHC